MNVVLDANVIIHLRQIGCSHILFSVAQKMGWQILLPNAVKAEATRKEPLDTEFTEAINNGRIIEVSSNKVTYSYIRSKHANLGDGELDSISIVSDCPDKTLKPYIVLSDDDQARKIGEKLGIRFVGILPVISLANNHGLLARQKALDYVESLGRNNFTPKKRYIDGFLKSLKPD